jgi:response regulator RpfG family c-di-GMP phosphodiesterase
LENEEFLFKRSETFMTMAREQLVRGNLADAVISIEVARQTAMSTTNRQLQADAQSRAAVIFFRSGKHDLALSAIGIAESIARDFNLPETTQLKIATNKAAVLQDAGFFKEAQIVQAKVLDATNGTTNPELHSLFAICAGNMIYCSLVTGKTRDALSKAKSLCDRIDDPHAPLKLDIENRTIIECWYATALSQSGDTRSALARLTAIREEIPAESLGLQIQFGIAMGVTEVRSDLADQGLTRLLEITATAEKRGLFYAQALHALILVYEHLGDIQRALENITKLERVMNEAARHFVGIEEGKESQEVKEDEDKENEKGKEDADAPPPNETIDYLDEHAANLRVRRFMELAQEERATVFDQIAVASALIDDETGKHCERVEALTYRFAKALGQTDEEAKLLSHAARLHDVGKVGIPHRVLLAPRKLTPMEYEIAKKHTIIGNDLLQFSTHEVVQLARVVALNHHEKWDGTGYPNKLFEDKIPLCARIVALVDVYDVLTNKRVYKRAWGAKEAREELAWGAGKHFDPHLTEVFLKVAVQYEIDTGLH